MYIICNKRFCCVEITNKLCYNYLQGGGFMNIAVCDDEYYWREAVSVLLNEYKNKRHIELYITCFSDGLSLTKSSKTFDVIFMDYQMEELNGVETARKLRSANNNCTIIFISAFPNTAPEAFEVNAFRFLVKPINKTKLFQSLDDYQKQIDKERFLVFKTHNGTVKIKESDIIYCEAAQKHTFIHTVNGVYELLINIKQIEKKLSNENFFRCHKAYIVSFFHISYHNNTDIILDNNEKVYISRKSLRTFRAAFQNYVIKYNLERI